MKYPISFLLILLSITSTVHAQPCTIQISYDNNGNRILREEFCLSPRPGQENPDKEIPRNKQALLPDTAAIGTFTVYPNPTADEVFVRLDALSLRQECTVILTDQLGREHFRKEQAGARTVVPLSNLPDGMYHIILFRGDMRNSVKIVKEAYRGGQ